MSAAHLPTLSAPREEWNDDFDFPDVEPIQTSDPESEKEGGGNDEEDWDLEMDLGKTGGAKVQTVVHERAVRSFTARAVPAGGESQLFTIRPPLASVDDVDEDDDGIPTIKGMVLPTIPPRPSPQATIDEDFEDGFALPSDLTQLSLRPLELNHRSSKSSLEWGDRDQTTSSQSSDAYSTLGFADHSPPSAYTSASLPETETEEEDEDEDLLDGLVLPSGLFESGHSAKKLVKMLETKKKAVVTDMRVKIASPDPEDDFESGLVLDDVMELSPSRLLQTAQQTTKISAGTFALRSKSVPRTSALTRPQSRSRSDRAKSPNVPPVSSSAQLRRLACPSPPPKSSSRSQTYSQAAASAPTPSTSKSSFLAPNYSSLRGQKSHSGLKAASPTSSRGLSRKASMPALSDHSPPAPTTAVPGLAKYNAPTASSKAKGHTNSTSRLHTFDYNVPPTRPSTPSANPAALRLTMPTSSSRLKARPPISSVFPSPLATAPPSLTRSASPLSQAPRPPSASASRPPSSKSRHSQTQSLPAVPPAKMLKRPKRTRTYGDGTELDDLDDLPLDREKESRYRVQPKPAVPRIPGSSYAAALLAPSISRKSQKLDNSGPDLAPRKTLKRTSRLDAAVAYPEESSHRTSRKKAPSSPATRRKPTLIRNLGGTQASKVVGEMKWNPQTLRWEGNDQALRDFDAAVGTSIRPALITHLTGSSIGSPVNSFAAGARKVGTMIFDPTRMCWISTLAPEDDEPDVFADLADDEDDDAWEAKADTLRPNQPISLANTSSVSQAELSASSAISRTRSRSESESDRCSRASMFCDVEDGFFEKCHAAEERHRLEMRGWTTATEADRSFLYEIRALATRQY
ncbi:hypothetical protein PHLGIDRAFT_17601 [Phlebiopsis gigantea 11061_1 CR5-6]|uniref:Protein byr4 n=1 Tax=Phlebiopsis gigantea (strain 11061_1 CR5-6) TaxID=745531 RepID=A0A0C3P3H3_PHLG1|nr:hypothetical protein PHLGIDRAFT_17601 [Phlebiopsis gigantea 11061_1 CR5-6]